MHAVVDIAILGAGAMGSLFGGLLAEAGHRVTLVDIDDAHLDAIRSEGLRLTTDTGTRVVNNLRVSRPEHVSVAPELLLVFTKTMHTEAALASVQSFLGRILRCCRCRTGWATSNGLRGMSHVNE
jgi:2-dehydropantoate 2-reductase